MKTQATAEHDFKAERAAYLAELQADGLTYSAHFVPQSQSRNANEKHHSLNWRAILTRKGAPVLATDYMQGIGHAPKHPQQKNGYPINTSLFMDEYYKDCAESGKGYSVVRGMGKPIPAPSLEDVLYSLVMDSSADDQTFEEWCDDYSYSDDSREAERTYNLCREIGSKLRRLIGAPALEKLRDLYQDY